MCVHMLGQYFEGLGSVRVCVFAAPAAVGMRTSLMMQWPWFHTEGRGDAVILVLSTSLDPAADIAVCGPLILYHWPQEMLCPS